MADRPSALHRMLLSAAAQDPSIEPAPAERILRSCLEILNEDPTADAAEVARRCVVRHPDADVSWISHLARAATRERQPH